ncbi:g2337 [Coccomyxa elongata]
MGQSAFASRLLLFTVTGWLLLGPKVVGQRSVPVSTSTQFAAALSNNAITEIILDPTGTGDGGGTVILQGADWVDNTYVIEAGRDLTIRSVNGNPTMLDLGRIPAILNIATNATLELRDLLLKNVATFGDLQNYRRLPNDNLTTVFGMLSWPSFYAQAGANLRIYNTTQYFWSYTLYRRADCNFALAGSPPPDEQVNVTRGQQNYKTLDSGYTLLVEIGLYRAVYPVFDYDTKVPLGGVGVNSENSQGYCVPTDSSANEVIAGLARAAAVRDSGASSNHTVAIAVGCAVGGAVLLLIVLAIGISIVVRRRRKEHGLGSAELASLRSLPMSGMSPTQSDSIQRTQTAIENEPLESHLLQHSRLRRLGPLDEEQVEVGPLLGRGSFGRVYKGRWRSTLVAIKVVEHASVSMDAMSMAEQKIEREALLATSLAHPNIIATFKICRMTAGSALGTNRSGMSTTASSFSRQQQRLGGNVPPEQQSGGDGGAAARRASGQDAGASGAESALGLYGGRTSRDIAGREREIGSGGSGRGTPGRGSFSSGGGGGRGAPAGGGRGGEPPASGEPSPTATPAEPDNNRSKASGLGPGRRGSGNLGTALNSMDTGGSAESFDPSTALMVGLPASSPPGSAPNLAQTKGSDSAQNNGGKRPGPAESMDEDLEMTPGEKEAEDDLDAIEERRSRLLETWCLMEYAEKGSLADALRTGRLRRPNGLPDLSMVLSCLTDIASGMEYLHAAGILHGDLKPANVLLKSTSADRRGFLCKLCDFGMSRLMDATQATHVSTQTYGTMPYMPPELLAHSQLTPQADVYSFGMVMWEIYTGQMPFANFTVGQVFFAVVHDHLRPPLDFFHQAMEKNEEERPILEAYIGLLECCWAEKAADRPKFPAILAELGGIRTKLAQLRVASGAARPGGGTGGARLAAGITSPFAAPSSPPATPVPGASPTTSARPPQRPAQPPAPAAPALAAEPDSGIGLLRSPSFEQQQPVQSGRPSPVPEEPAAQPQHPPQSQA